MTICFPKPSSTVQLQQRCKLVPAWSLLPEANVAHGQVGCQHILFCYRLLASTIKSLQLAHYTDFDAHTAANCCHGISLLARDWILALNKLEVERVASALEEQIQCLAEMNRKSMPLDHVIKVPISLLGLARLYALKIGSMQTDDYVVRTETERLNQISPISRSFGRRLIAHLQAYVANTVADRYQILLSGYEPFLISGIQSHQWIKYVGSSYLRTDNRGRRYAAAAYSCQVALGYMMQQQAKLAIVNDLFSSQGEYRGRYVRVVQGAKNNGFSIMEQSSDTAHYEPVVVFGGACYSDNISPSTLEQEMDRWAARIDSLVLACDCYYPQFPSVSDDPSFNSSPIRPTEDSLINAFAIHARIAGVSSADPTLWCLSHIYPASLEQVLADGKGQPSLPISHVGSKYRQLRARNVRCA
ncbi:MAG: hypothetical protein AB7M93_30010 [Candidatus Obscuribacterales bacterium]